VIPQQSLDLSGIPERVMALRARYAARDQRMYEVQSVRRGNFEAIAPDLFNDQWRRPIVANLVDTTARDTAAVLAPLPTFNCSAPSGLSERAKAFADKRTKIVRDYILSSDLELQMLRGADQYVSYGMLVFCIEPDLDKQMPRIQVEDAIGAYPVWNSKGETVELARVYYRDYFSLVADYPHLANFRQDHPTGVQANNRVMVVKYVSKDRILIYLPEWGDLVLEDMKNPLGQCYYVAVQRPGLDDEIRGAFDDVIWIQLARHRIQMLLMEGVDKAVRAPLVVPPDAGDIALGPDSIITTQAGVQGVGRARLDMPQQAFGAVDYLKTEQQLGAMSPESRMGQQDASVITGRGIQQLMAGFSSQIAAAQTVFKIALRRALRLAFVLDERMFGDVKKEIRGNDAGIPYSITYVPKKDIDGDHSVDITYGFAAGLDPNRALVFLLQADGAGLVSKDYVRRNLPTDINAVEEEKKIAIEQSRQALVAAFGALANAIPQMAAQGGDPSQIIQQQAKFISLMQEGDTVEAAAMKVLAPPKPPPAAEAPPGAPVGPDGQPVDPGAAGGSEPPPGMAGPGVLPEAAAQPGGRPPLQEFLAGLGRNGQPNLQAAVSRQNPAGG
jgi:hypothetical protein